ncbi:serine/threonine protein kinase [Gordonia neofelifaecis NRRL B-59395]|uniref:non-specific serine/threonine protein kinase n=1 Tax=Gordonia neofelifaecis NRRL B-59395 TaxID=644548 RepID=F1YH90_9ACTN|nr:serine/threonine protein kinase [Gordonia neofelifaecis NRRL B-59395]
MSKAPGTTIAGYRVVELLGSGGMGDVYIVENEQLQRREAMKVISVGGASNPDFQQRFNNEARTMAALDHPSIVTIHNYGIVDDQPWFTMSFIDGPNLSTARLTPAEVVQAITQVADGLDYAHSRPVVHRDIKPANIVVTRAPDGALRRAYLLDFGIAKLADSPQLTAVNSIIGTVTYTAPEVIGGAHAGPASDQYSLACTVYELLAGRPPFAAENSTALMMAHVQQPAPPLGAVRPDLDALTPVLMRAMAKDPSARFPDCRSFAAALEAALRQTAAGQHTIVAPVTPPPSPSGPAPTPTPAPPISAPQTTPYTPGQPQPPYYAAGPGPNPQYGAPAPYQQAPVGYGAQPPFPGPPSGPAPYGFVGGPQQPPKKKSKTPWIIAAVVAVALIAVAATSPLWWPSSSDSTATETFAAPQIAGAYGSECMVNSGELFCWGDNASGQLGDGTTSARKSPSKVPGLGKVTSVAMGAYDSTGSSDSAVTTCAVSDDALYCWGDNLFWQAGDSSTMSKKTSPFKVPGLGKVTAVSTSNSSTCAISDGDLYCWGFYSGGQLGNGNTSESLKTPTKVAGISNVTAVSSRAGSVCAIASGDLYCWGRNWDGQLGDGTTDDRSAPNKVPSLSNVTSMTVGGGSIDNTPFWNTCAVADGSVYCWGNNKNQQLARDGESQKKTPLKIEGLSNATDVSVDIGSFCAIADGNVSCWGNNLYGQVGNGNTSQQYSPQQVQGVSDARQVVTSYSVTCAITSSTQYCWGLNKTGQQGDPARTDDQITTPHEIKLAA